MSLAINNGDVVLVRQTGPVAWSIALGARMRYGWRTPFSRYSHVALVYDAQQASDVRLIEARGRTGVHYAWLSAYAGKCQIVHTGVAEHDWSQMRAFLESALGERYGWLTYLGLTVYDITGSGVCVQKAGTAICSGLVADALTRAGFIWPRPPFASTVADIDATLAERHLPRSTPPQPAT